MAIPVSQVGVVVLILLAARAAAAQLNRPPQASNCPDHCGNLIISYPFGIGPNCYMTKAFSVKCNTSTNPPRATWIGDSTPITNISLADGEMQILANIALDCYNNSGRARSIIPKLWTPPLFSISHTKNKFVAVGCDTYAIFRGYRADEERYTTGCMSICDNLDSVETSCSGIGCCQTEIPSGIKNRTIALSSYYNHSDVLEFNPCSYAFIVEKDNFTFSPNTSFEELSKTKRLPMILNWEIGNTLCDEAEKRDDYACKGSNSRCVNELNGYICQCLPGYEGNPYLEDSCQDINECENKTLCGDKSTCINSPGNYTCQCEKGFRNDDNDRNRCVEITRTFKSKSTELKVSLGVTVSIIVLLGVTFWIYCGMKKRKFNQLKIKYFKDNGGVLLQNALQDYDGPQAAKIYSKEELKIATNNFHDSGKIGEGGYGFVYKGTLSDKKEVAIKVPKSSAPMTQSGQFINEVLVLSQINHRNVVRLLGCCLETQTPLLVYEFVKNGTLYEHIHKKNGKGPLPFGLRMKIAAEIAGSLAYLHYSTSMQIVHRDVKATNILLDENFTAKVSDFGASKLVPDDKDQLSTLVQGTLGYLDPEYLQSNTLTEKSDVYSFGVVLVELITSQVAVSYHKPEAERNLANFFVTSVEKDRLEQILDHEIIKEGSFESAEQVARLAGRCLSLKGGDRPTMIEVAKELDGILAVMAKHPGGTPYSSPKETDYLLASPANAYVVEVRGDDGEAIIIFDYDQSMHPQAQMMKPAYDGGR